MSTHSSHFTSSSWLRWSGRTDAGTRRSNNEDAFFGLQFDAREAFHLGRVGEAPHGTMDLAFGVSDGVGGARAGEFASRVAVQGTIEFLPRLFQRYPREAEASFAEGLEELFDRIHRGLQFVGNSYEECGGMETTLSLCWFRPGRMHFAHIGDSRIYYLPAQSGGIQQVSEDDTHVGWLFRTGQLSEWESRTHPRRKLLQKALGGSNQFVQPQVGSVAYERGDLFVICSDGIVEGLTNQGLLEQLRESRIDPPGDDFALRLVSAAVRSDGSDNTTAVVVAAV